MLSQGTKWLAEEQEMLYAQQRWSLRLVFQAMDAAGKDGAIKHVIAELRAFHQDYMEAAIDKAQGVVFEAVKRGDMGAATFLLTTVGKERGFSTKQELTLVKSESFDTLGEEETVERLRVARDKINKMLEDGAAG